MSITSDALYPPWQQRQLADGLRGAGVPCELVDIDSPHGHDGFLLTDDQVGPPIARFLEEVHAHG